MAILYPRLQWVIAYISMVSLYGFLLVDIFQWPEDLCPSHVCIHAFLQLEGIVERGLGVLLTASVILYSKLWSTSYCLCNIIQ